MHKRITSGVCLCLFVLFVGVLLSIPALIKRFNEVSYGKILKSPNADWLTYAGDYAASRYSSLKQINRGNVHQLVPRWIYRVDGETGNLRVTPLVSNGVMYITNAYEIQALDAASGKRLWYWRSLGFPQTWMNRGAAILGEKVFFITKDCVLVALDSKTGQLIWSKKYADTKKGYYCTVAPLALKDRIVAGVSGGDEATRGFVAAFAASDGQELWRLWTIPARGEPGSETWGNTFDLNKGGAATWVSGSYDHRLNTIYWTTGNPWPDFEGDVRPGDNLYSNCVLAIDPDNGKLKWYFQFMPHDMHDWDANEFPVLVDMAWWGSSRKLLMQANRNGFFYVLDRTNGEFLFGKPFVNKLTWAIALNSRGRPVEIPGMNDGWGNEKQKGVCPGLIGATNWMSPSYNPETGLFYVVALESCDMERGQYHLRAINPQDGSVRWDYPMPGPANMYAGTLSTAGGLVFAGDDAGNLVALEAGSGQKLWSRYAAKAIFASPMTYAVKGQQYVAIAAGYSIFSFALPQ